MQLAPERAVEVRPVVQGVHLVHRHAVEIAGVGLDGVEQDDRLAVGQRQDQVRARVEVLQYGSRRRRLGHVVHRRTASGAQ